MWNSDVDYNAHFFGHTDAEILDREEDLNPREPDDDDPLQMSADELEAVYVSGWHCDLCQTDAPHVGDTALYDMRTELSCHERECAYRVAREKEQK